MERIRAALNARRKNCKVLLERLCKQTYMYLYMTRLPGNTT